MTARAALRGGILDRIICILASMTFAVAPIAAQAQQLPTGGSVAAGSASIGTPHNGTLNVNQSSDRAVINWNSFSVGQGGTVNFVQPGASSATLNRVTGTTPSSIAGTINAPGTVLLVNPNGIAISNTGVVNVGSFAASTLDIKDKDFMSGNYKFTGSGASAAVTNAGRINVSDGGFAALLGGQVANDGIITARLGRVGLGSGELITLDLSGDGFLSVGVPTSALGKIVGSNGQALVSNKGKIVADGGIVHLSAATAAGILRDAVNVPGSIRANSVGTSNGRIVIGGGAGGRVQVAGNVRANGRNGGTVSVSGAAIGVSGKISASGRKGGTVTLAADQSVDIWGKVSAKGRTGAGGTIVATANDVKLASAAVLDAGGASGGTVLVGGDYQGGANAANDFVTYPILNAFATTVAAGAQIKADGSNGAGGKIVVWSDDHTTFAGAISAQGGGDGQGGFAEVSGHRLLDFTGTANLLAANGAAGTLLLDPRNVTISSSANSGGSIASGTYTPSADDSILNVTTLQTALLSGNVIVTTGSTGSQSGDITVASPVTWTSHTLTLDAYHSINVNATMSATGSAGLALKTNDGGSGGSLNFNGGNVTFASTGQALSINGASYTLLNSMTGVQNINNGLSGNYALAKSLDATGVSNWVPIGTDGAGNIQNSNKGFTGNFNGLGNTISNLTINLPSVQNIGLFGAASGASISSLALTNVNVAGGDHTGALLGFDGAGISVNGVSASGSVSGQYQTGGLIGWFDAGSTLTRGSAAVTVTSPVDDVGGLVGYADGNVFQSFATGNVTGQYNVGGLIGRAAADVGSPSVQQSFATGAVTGLSSVGGLIGGATGVNQVTVQQSYATGTTRATSLYSVLGGLIGSNSTTLTVSESYATGWINTPNTYAGGLIGHYGSTTPAVTSSYYDADTTGSIVGGVSTSTLQAALPSGWSSSVWGIVAGKSYPFFLWQYPAAGGAPQVISGTALTGSGSNSTPGVTVSALVNGAGVGSAMTGINGYYNILVAPNTIAANSQVAVYTTATTDTVAGLTYQQNTPAGSLSGLNVNAAFLTEMSQASTLSAVSAGLATAIGSTGVSTSYGDRWIIAQGASFTIDQAITQSGLLRLSAAGNVTQAAGASLDVRYLSLQMISGAANYTLLDTGNKVVNLSTTNVGSGSLSLYDSVDLVAGSTVANGGMLIQTAGTLTINNTISSSASGNAIVLVAGNTFTNKLGASALSASNGRWLVYSSNPTNDAFNNLDSGNTAVWNGTYAANAPATIASGNRYVFAYQPTVTLTSSNASKTYGATPDLSANFTVGGLNAGVAHVYLADTAATAYSGAPALTSAGSAASASVAGGPYLIDISQGSVTGSNGYAVSFVDAGMLTVNKASLTVSAGASKTYDGQAFSGGSVSYSGFVNGETASVLGGTLTYGGTAQGAVNAGSYTLTASGQTSSNYTISYTAGALTVAKANLAVTANDAGKTYDGLAFSGGNDVSYTGFVNGETSAVLGGTLAYGGTAQGAKNAGSYTLSASGLTSSNYNISYTDGSLTVARANLAITAKDAGKTYDGLAFTGGNGVTYSGFVNGETASVLGGTLAYGGTAQGAKNAGSYSLTASGLTSNNYAISYAAGALSIGKASLTVTANNAGKTYDGLAYSSGNGVSYAGFVNGETASVLGGTLAYGGTAQGATNAGSYSLTASGLSSNNYAIAYTAGALSIGKAALTVTARDAGKTYDGLAFSGGNGVSYSGFVNGETAAVLGGTVTYGGTAQGATNAGSYSLTAAGLTSTNYAINYTAGALSIGKVALTVAANDAGKTYDGLAFSGGNGVSYSGFVNGETAAVLGGTVTYGGTAQGAINAGSYSLTAAGLTSTNYAINYTAGALSIGKAALTVTANDAGKTYDGLAFSGGNGVTYAGLVNGETASVLGGTLAYGGTARGATNAGSYSLTASGLTSANYTIAYNPGALTIGKAALTVTANDAGKTYDGLAFSGGNGVTYAGLVNGETAAVLGGALAYGGTAQGATNAGSYSLTAAGLSSNNYTIAYNPGALTIGKAALTVTANDAGKTYDGLAFSGGNGVTYSGLVNGETSAVLGGTLAYGGTAQGAKNAGSYSLTASGLTSANYAISYTAGALNVAKANLTVTANDAAKTYGSTLSFNGSEFTTQGLVSGDAVSSVTLASAGAPSSANVGHYAITASNAAGSGLSNYNVSYVGGTLNVTAATLLVVTANNAGKTYGDTLSFNGSEFSTQGLQNGDTVTSVMLASAGAAATANAGQYAITASNAVGSGLSNYSISYAPGTLTVAKANLTITANDAAKTYGNALTLASTAFSAGAGQLKNGDSIDTVTLASLGTAATANAGGYAITGSAATGSSFNAANYNISYVAGTLTVGKAALTVTANDAGKTYDGLAFSGGNGVTYAGFVNGETASVLGGALAYGGTAQGAKNAGSYSLTASGLTSANYTIAYTAGALSIGKAALTVTANDAGKTYDGLAFSGGNGVTYAGLVNGETASVLGGTLAYAGTAQGATNAGSYSLTAAGLSSNNYTISYAAGALNVAKANLTITANDTAKTYDGLAFSGGNGVTYAGLVNGETASVLGGTLAYGGTAQGATNAGSYSLTASGLTSTNYAISYTAGALNVAKANLTITANDAAKTYGDTLSFNGSEFSTQGLQNGDTVTSVMLASAGAAATANAGQYAITASNAVGSGLSNYSISYAPGTLTVAKANLTITANDAAKTYDGLAFSGGNGISYSGFVNGETESVLGGTLAYGGTAQGAKNAGSYSLTASGLTATNYAINYTAGALSIGKAALTVTANDAGKTYDGLAFSGGNGVTYAGLVNGETASVLGGALAYGGTAQAATNAGSYSLTAAGLTSANYTISYTAGALSVGKAALTVAANDAGKTYDGLAFSGGNGVTYSGFVNGETASVLGGAVAYGGSAQGAKNAGSYSLTASGLTSANYAISYTAGALSIGKATLTYTADAASRTYGDSNPAFMGTVIGFVNGETQTSATTGALGFTSSADVASHVGSYAITGSGLSAANYTLVQSAGNATALTVHPAMLTYVADATSRTYGDANPALSGMVTGFKNSDTLTSATTGTAVWTTTATASSNVGGVAVVGSGLASSDYAFTQAAANSAALTITPATLTMTAAAASRSYGDANPVLSGSISGFKNAQSAADFGGAGWATSAAVTSNVGSYGITGGLAAMASNYVLVQAASNASALTVTRRAITATADAQSKLVGELDPLLSYTLTNGSLVGADTLSGALSRISGENVGNYAILQGSLAASKNYALSFVGADLAIHAAPVAPVTTPDAGLPASRYIANAGGTTPVVATISFQNPTNTTAPVIQAIGGTAPAARTAALSGPSPTMTAEPAPAQPESTAAALNVSQDVAPGAGPDLVFLPISQFDKTQYSDDKLPEFAPKAAEVTIATMIARALASTPGAPKIDQLWRDEAADWADVGGVRLGNAGQDISHPAVAAQGPAFANGTLDIAALLSQGPVIFSAAKHPEEPVPELLAIAMTADGKGILANDPGTGLQVILAYDPAARMIGDVTSVIDPRSRQPVALGTDVPDFGARAVQVPAQSWADLKAFRPASYVGLTIKR